MFLTRGTRQIRALTHCLPPTGLAVSSSSELLRLQADGEERLHSVHDDRVRRLPAPQRARAASPGVETLLPVRALTVTLRGFVSFNEIRQTTAGKIVHLFKAQTLDIKKRECMLPSVLENTVQQRCDKTINCDVLFNIKQQYDDITF